MARDVPFKGPHPYPLWPGGDNRPRRGVWRGAWLVPAVTLTTTARLRPGLAQARPRELLLSVIQAASGGLSLFPRLNYFNFEGDLVWAGRPERVAVVMENADYTCDLVVVADAHRRSREDIAQALKEGRGGVPSGRWHAFRERWPRLGNWLDVKSGTRRRLVLEHSAPLFISMLGVPGIETVAFTPTHSMALYPGWPEDGRLPLTLCFSHQLANARPVGKMLMAMREMLE